MNWGNLLDGLSDPNRGWQLKVCKAVASSVEVELKLTIPATELGDLLIGDDPLPEFKLRVPRDTTNKAEHPGLLLTRLMDHHGILIDALAKKLDISQEILERILKGKNAMPVIIAVQLEQDYPMLEMRAEDWMYLQSDFTVFERREELLRERNPTYKPKGK